MKILTKKEISEQVTDELFYWILDGTQDAIWKFEDRINKLDFLQVHKISDLMRAIKMCTDLAFAFDSNADWLLNELVKFKKFLSKKEFNFSGSAIMEELDAHIQKIKSGNYTESDFSTTEGDIAVAEKQMEEEKRQAEPRKKELIKERRQDIQMKKENVEKWRAENINENFNVSILDEFQLKILQEALETELKCLSISWLQRKFNIGYPKACVIVDFFEKHGIVSTYEESCELGVDKYGRIIRIDIE